MLKKMFIKHIFQFKAVKDGTKNCSRSIYICLKPKSDVRNLQREKFSYVNYYNNLNKKHLSLNSAASYLPPSTEIKELADNIIFENQNEFSDECKDELMKSLNFLISLGYKISDIKKHSQYLNISSCTYSKIQLLAEIDSNVLLLLPLLPLPVTSLRLASKQARLDKNLIKRHSNRISYLCYHLDLSTSELLSALLKHPALLTMKFQRLDQKMNILKNAKISAKYIVKDLWIFNYTEKLLVDRIQAAEKAGIDLKPWMLRCSKSFFRSMLEKVSETQRILGGEDEISYLSKKLDCNKEYIEYMMGKNKLLKSINIPKLEQVITFLYEKGYTPQEVRLFPRVFCSSVQTLNRKFDKFHKLRKTLPTISQLCISSRNFEASLERNKK